MTQRRRSRGMTLIEVIIAGAILLLLIATALGLFVDVNGSVGDAMSTTESALEGNRIQTLIKQELRAAGNMRLGATNNAGVFVQGATNRSPIGAFTSVQYTKINGFTTSGANVSANYSELREIRFEFDNGEDGGGSGDDTDGDRDLRVDEGKVVLMADKNGDGSIAANEVFAVFGGNISGDDFSFSFPSGGDFATTSDPADQTLTVQFTSLLRRGTSDGADGTTGLSRTLIIPLRNNF